MKALKLRAFIYIDVTNGKEEKEKYLQKPSSGNDHITFKYGYTKCFICYN